MQRKRHLNSKIYKGTFNKTAQWCLDTRTLVNGTTLGRRYFFVTKSDAEIKRVQMIENHELDISPKVYASDRRIKDMYKEFVYSDYYRKKNKKSGKNRNETNEDKLSRFNNYLLEYFQDDKVSSLCEESLVDVTQYIQELEKENGDSISDYLQYRIWVDVKSFLNYCLDKKYIVENIRIPFDAGIAKPTSKKPDSWTKEEFDLFMEQVDNDTYRLFFQLLAMCGPRKSEARGIKFNKVNFLNKNIAIDTQLKNVKEGDSQLKTKDSERKIDVPDIVLNGIKKEMEKREKTGISKGELLQQYIFVDDRNNPIPFETLRRNYKKYVAKAGIRYLPIHALRHFYATQAFANGATIAYVQDQLGHSRRDVTVLIHYNAVLKEEHEKNIDVWNKLYPA